MTEDFQNNRLWFITMLGGTATGLYKALQAGDLLKTIVLAGVGTTVSFLVTLSLKKLFKKR